MIGGDTTVTLQGRVKPGRVGVAAATATVPLEPHSNATVGGQGAAGQLAHVARTSDLAACTSDSAVGTVVTGRLVDTLPQPVKGVVWFDQGRLVESKADGRFEIQQAVANELLYASAPHYRTARAEVEGAGNVNVGDIVLQRESTVQVILDAGSSNVSAAKVACCMQGKRAFTDQRGVATFIGIVPGSASIEVNWLPGSSSCYKIEVYGDADYCPVLLYEANFIPVTIEAADARTGTVVLSLAGPQGYCLTKLMKPGCTELLTSLPGGEYTVCAQVKSHAPGEGCSIVQTTVNIGDPWSNEPIVLRIPSTEVSGVILDSNYNPVSATEVISLDSSTGIPGKSVVTGPDGTFKFFNYSCGTYLISARHDNCGCGTVTVTLNSNSPEAPVTICLAKGAHFVATAISAGELTRLASIPFAVSDPCGTIDVLRTNGIGQFRIDNLGAGTYRISCQAKSWRMLDKMITVENSGTTHVELVCNATGSVEVACVDAQDKTITGATVSIHAANSRKTDPAWTSESRRFDGLWPGDYVVMAYSPYGGRLSRQVTVKARETSQLKLRLP